MFSDDSLLNFHRFFDIPCFETIVYYFFSILATFFRKVKSPGVGPDSEVKSRGSGYVAGKARGSGHSFE